MNSYYAVWEILSQRTETQPAPFFYLVTDFLTVQQMAAVSSESEFFVIATLQSALSFRQKKTILPPPCRNRRKPSQVPDSDFCTIPL